MESKRRSKGFLERIVDFDFEKNYTKQVKILSHLTIWGGYAALYFSYTHFGNGFTIEESLLMTVRVTLLNMIVFYLFFYVAVPYFLGNDRIILFVISIPLLIQLYIILNRIFYGLVLKLDFPIESPYMIDLMERVKDSTVWDSFSLRTLQVRALDVIFGISPLFFIKTVFDLTQIYAKSIKTNRRVEELKTENLKMENKFLNAQLNPHFLFNTLNNLYGLALKKDDLTPELILKLSEIMRYTLYEANVDSIPLTKEIQFIEDYVGLEKMRFNKEINLVKEVPNRDIEDLRIAPLLPFVFLENAFKYGLKSENPFLRIRLAVEDKCFYFKIENDRLPIDSKGNEASGIGLENVKKRLELIYPEKHNLTINEEGNSYSVKLVINLS